MYLRRLHLPQACSNQGSHNPALSIHLLYGRLYGYPQNSRSNLRQASNTLHMICFRSHTKG